MYFWYWPGNRHNRVNNILACHMRYVVYKLSHLKFIFRPFLWWVITMMSSILAQKRDSETAGRNLLKTRCWPPDSECRKSFAIWLVWLMDSYFINLISDIHRNFWSNRFEWHACTRRWKGDLKISSIWKFYVRIFFQNSPFYIEDCSLGNFYHHKSLQLNNLSRYVSHSCHSLFMKMFLVLRNVKILIKLENAVCKVD